MILYAKLNYCTARNWVELSSKHLERMERKTEHINVSNFSHKIKNL